MAIRRDTDELIAFLDSIAKIDPKAMGALLAARVPCGQQLAHHPSVQVSAGGQEGHKSVHAGDSDVPPNEFRLGFLGLLNGYAGTFDVGPRKGWGPITAVVEDDGSVSGFRRTDASIP